MQIVTIRNGKLHFKDIEIVQKSVDQPSNDDYFNLSILSENERDFFEERAAIMEYDGGLSREDAERLAWERVFLRRKCLN